MSDRDRLHLFDGHRGRVDLGARDHMQHGTLAALSGRHSDVSQPHLTAVSQQARRSLSSGSLSPFRMSSQMTFNNGTQPDQLVLGKRVHNHLLPPAKPGWRRSGTRRRLGPLHQV